MPEASRALNHFLNGRPLVILCIFHPDGTSSPVTRKARDDLKQQVINEVNSLKQSQCKILPNTMIHKESSSINISPGFSGIPDDRQAVLGAHILSVNAYLNLVNLAASYVGWIKYEFYVYEWYDFRKGAGNVFTIPVLGWEVPTAWADFLVDAGNAAEYWTVVRWTDHDLYWK